MALFKVLEDLLFSQVGFELVCSLSTATPLTGLKTFIRHSKANGPLCWHFEYVGPKWLLNSNLMVLHIWSN